MGISLQINPLHTGPPQLSVFVPLKIRRDLGR
jgi:hypothetical protein